MARNVLTFLTLTLDVGSLFAHVWPIIPWPLETLVEAYSTIEAARFPMDFSQSLVRLS